MAHFLTISHRVKAELFPDQKPGDSPIYGATGGRSHDEQRMSRPGGGGAIASTVSSSSSRKNMFLYGDMLRCGDTVKIQLIDSGCFLHVHRYVKSILEAN